MYDVIIIGAGAAGLTAAIYTSRRALQTLVISKDVGGQASMSSHIENYPGVGLINGVDLMLKFKTQAEQFGASFVFGQVEEIKKEKDKFIIRANGDTYEAGSLILAFGLTPRDLGVPGEEKFRGKGISYCATCDAPFFRNKTVAVVGGGNSALDAALLLSKIAAKVYLVHRRDEFKGEEILVGQVKENDKIELVLSSGVREVKGDKLIESIIVENKDGNKKEIMVNGIFVEIGHEVKADFIRSLVKLNEKNEIIIDSNCQTSEPGIFAAGDVTDIEYKQIVISAGEGAKAALSAYQYLQNKTGKKGAGIDWGVKKQEVDK